MVGNHGLEYNAQYKKNYYRYISKQRDKEINQRDKETNPKTNHKRGIKFLWETVGTLCRNCMNVH
jgi:hypothetical protein